MGVGCDAIEILIGLKQNGYLERASSVIDIGELANSFLEARDEVERLGRLFGIDVPCLLPPPIPTHLVHGSLDRLDSSAPTPALVLWLSQRAAAIAIFGATVVMCFVTLVIFLYA